MKVDEAVYLALRRVCEHPEGEYTGIVDEIVGIYPLGLQKGFYPLDGIECGEVAVERISRHPKFILNIHGTAIEGVLIAHHHEVASVSGEFAAETQSDSAACSRDKSATAREVSLSVVGLHF